MRPIGRSLTLGLLMTALAVLPVAAASNKPLIIDLNDPAVDVDDSAFFTAECGFPVVADTSGHIIIHMAKGGGPVVSKSNYNIRSTLTSANGTVRIVDAGPDITIVRNGTTYFVAAGRSNTGTGVIGRVVINSDTLEVISVSGRLVGQAVLDPFPPVCEALGPAQVERAR